VNINVGQIGDDNYRNISDNNIRLVIITGDIIVEIILDNIG
jgi:hypothetical protein